MGLDITMSSEANPSPDEAAAESGIDLGLRSTGLTFQTRIAVVALVTAVAVLMTACLLFMLEQWRTEQAHFVQNQTIAAKVMAGNIGADISRAPAEIRVDLDSLRLDPRIRSAIFVDAQGKPAVVVERAGKTAAAHADGVVVVASPVMSGGVRKGMLVISSDAEGMSELLPRFISMGGALFFVAAGLALFMGRWLAGRLTRPVERLSNAMHEVAGSGP